MSEDPEIAAMSKVAAALASLDDEARARVIDWTAKKYGVTLAANRSSSSHAPGAGQTPTPADGDAAYAAFVDLFDHANPRSNPERALIGGYWFQEIGGHPSFDAQEVNDALKDVGHGIGNITQAFNSLQDRKPALVRQMGKSGKTKQARKTYKLTTGGTAGSRPHAGRYVAGGVICPRWPGPCHRRLWATCRHPCVPNCWRR